MNERLLAISTRLTEHLHSVITEFQITEDELRKAIDFFTAVGKSGEYPLLSDVLLVSIAVDNITHGAKHDSKSTESNVEGPLYREEAPIMSFTCKYLFCREIQRMIFYSCLGRYSLQKMDVRLQTQY